MALSSPQSLRSSLPVLLNTSLPISKLLPFLFQNISLFQHPFHYHHCSDPVRFHQQPLNPCHSCPQQAQYHSDLRSQLAFCNWHPGLGSHPLAPGYYFPRPDGWPQVFLRLLFHHISGIVSDHQGWTIFGHFLSLVCSAFLSTPVQVTAHAQHLCTLFPLHLPVTPSSMRSGVLTTCSSQEPQNLESCLA